MLGSVLCGSSAYKRRLYPRGHARGDIAQREEHRGETLFYLSSGITRGLLAADKSLGNGLYSRISSIMTILNLVDEGAIGGISVGSMTKISDCAYIADGHTHDAVSFFRVLMVPCISNREATMPTRSRLHWKLPSWRLCSYAGAVLGSACHGHDEIN